QPTAPPRRRRRYLQAWTCSFRCLQSACAPELARPLSIVASPLACGQAFGPLVRPSIPPRQTGGGRSGIAGRARVTGFIARRGPLGAGPRGEGGQARTIPDPPEGNASCLMRGVVAPGDAAMKLRKIAVGLLVVLVASGTRSEEHTSELQSRENLVCRLLLEKK